MRQRSSISERAGFTLLEALLVLVILSLAAALAAPLMRRPPSRALLTADATRIASALRVTRAAAMAQNREMSLVIDAAQRTYASPVIPVSRMDPRLEIAMDIAEPERTSSTSGGIRFFPSGRSTGGGIRLRLEQAEAHVQVIWATGHAFLEE
jgi:general secretion pathway protein H